MSPVYSKKLYGATFMVTRELEFDAKFDLGGYVSSRLVSMLEREAENVQGFLDYDTMMVERSEETPFPYEHTLSREEMPLWRFVLSMLPFVRRPKTWRQLPPMIRYSARAYIEVPEEEE